MSLARHPLDCGNVKPGNHGVANMRHPLEVQRPSRLLVEVRTRELPQLGSIHSGDFLFDSGGAITYNFVSYCWEAVKRFRKRIVHARKVEGAMSWRMKAASAWSR